MTKEVEDKLKKIPVLGWIVRKSKQIILPGMEGLSLYDLWEIYSLGIIKGAFSLRANSISFNFFMAIFPFLLFLLNLIPFIWFIDDFQLKFLVFVDKLLPPQTHEFFGDIFTDIASNQRVGLLSFVFVLSIFLMANGINAIFEGFESSYHTQINRSFVRQYVVAIGVSIIVALLLLLTVIATIYLTYMIENLRDFGLFSDSVVWAEIGRYAVFVVMVYIGVATLYYLGTREGRLHRFFSVGALFTMLLIVLTTFLFAIYINNFSTYNELYGSIGALLILMVYIWLNSNILLLGFELNASLNKMRKKHNNQTI
ncbi:MAG TPA: YihY/virulence factor BrkB family protein [Flavobacteriaceae bacterium]|nr:YihY/virulence factor BrkB family protein [Flavobacteriaceae bacterium]